MPTVKDLRIAEPRSLTCQTSISIEERIHAAEGCRTGAVISVVRVVEGIDQADMPTNVHAFANLHIL